MALITCPECGRAGVSDSAKACPNCGYQISAYVEKQTINDVPTYKELTPARTAKPKSRAVVIAIVAVIIIWVIWFFSTRCVKDGCYNRASSNGYCTYHNIVLDSYRYSSSNSYSSKSSSDLKISNVNVRKTSSTMYCTGTIKNNGSSTFKFVEVKAAFKDWQGNTIETGWSYAVGNEGLASGESTSFTIYADKKNDDVCSCDVSVYDYS